MSVLAMAMSAWNTFFRLMRGDTSKVSQYSNPVFQKSVSALMCLLWQAETGGTQITVLTILYGVYQQGVLDVWALQAWHLEVAPETARMICHGTLFNF